MIEPIIDVSRWQDDIDASKMLSAGTLGLYIRAGSIDKNSGACYADYQFANNAQKFNGKIPCGYYWYFRPEFNPSMQATYLVNLLKNVRVDLPTAIDVESNNKNVSMNIFQSRIYEFLVLIEDLVGEACIYTRAEFWNYHVGSPVWAWSRKLWIARYNSELSHPWGDGFFKPLPWNDWWMWQYSSPGNNRASEFGVPPEGDDDIDINRYNGTLDEFYADANWAKPEPPIKAYCKMIMMIKNLCDKFLQEHCRGE